MLDLGHCGEGVVLDGREGGEEAKGGGVCFADSAGFFVDGSCELGCWAALENTAAWRCYGEDAGADAVGLHEALGGRDRPRGELPAGGIAAGIMECFAQ